MLVKIETTTFRGHSVRAGYVYDDATLDVVSIWCENDTGLKMTVKTADKRELDFKRDEKPEVDVKAKNLKVTLIEGRPALYGVEMRYVWQ